MRRSVNISVLAMAIVITLMLVGSSTFACPNCYGDPESPMTDGMNMAILSLLGITGGMLALFSAFFLYLRRRFKLINEKFTNRLN